MLVDLSHSSSDACPYCREEWRLPKQMIREKNWSAPFSETIEGGRIRVFLLLDEQVVSDLETIP